MFFAIYIILKGKKNMNLLETKRMKAAMDVATYKVNSILINEDFKKTVKYTSFALLGITALSILNSDIAFAADVNLDKVEWPWTKILNSLKTALTGETAKILGTLGLVIAAIGLFMGNLGDGVKKLFIIMIAVCLAIWAPTLMELLEVSATSKS